MAVDDTPMAPLRRPKSPNRRPDGEPVGYNRRGIDKRDNCQRDSFSDRRENVTPRGDNDRRDNFTPRGDDKRDNLIPRGVNDRRDNFTPRGANDRRDNFTPRGDDRRDNITPRGANDKRDNFTPRDGGNRNGVDGYNKNDSFKREENQGQRGNKNTPVQPQMNKPRPANSVSSRLQVNDENVEENRQKVVEPKCQPEQKPVQRPEIQMPKYQPKTPVQKNQDMPATVPKTKEEPLVPAKCIIDLLEVNSTFLLSVENTSKECKDTRSGFICLSLTETWQEGYESLCGPYSEECESAADFTPKPGESFSLFVPEDGAYYRGRCINSNTAALLDGAKVVNIEGAKSKVLSKKYAEIPEFCCLLTGGQVKVGDQLKGTITSKTAFGAKVTLYDVETEREICEAEVTRWTPEVEYPKVEAVDSSKPSTSNANAVTIPSVPRPPLSNKTSVFLVDVTDTKRAVVRPAEDVSRRQFDTIEQDVATYGLTATPLKEPPVKGQVVVSKYINGLHYRALCRRTNQKQNKYLLEYIEYGNEEINQLENLYPCPSELNLDAKPAVSSVIQLHDVNYPLNTKALEYIEALKEEVLLTLTLPNNQTQAPSGSEAILTVSERNENVNNKLKNMCKPEWEIMQENGKDVFESKVLMVHDLSYFKLPPTACDLQILESNMLSLGALSVCMSEERWMQHMEYVLGPLTKRMNDFCNSEIGRAPYLPRDEEMCIAKFPPFEQWFRAVKMESTGGPGSNTSLVMYIDYGNIATIDNKDIRKMLPEFLTDLPAVALSATIKDFPQNLSRSVLSKVKSFLQIDEEGNGGVISVTSTQEDAPGSYSVTCPALIEMIKRLKIAEPLPSKCGDAVRRY